jgi:hypothetical protein
MTQNSSFAPLMKTDIDLTFVFGHELSDYTQDVFNLTEDSLGTLRPVRDCV